MNGAWVVLFRMFIITLRCQVCPLTTSSNHMLIKYKNPPVTYHKSYRNYQLPYVFSEKKVPTKKILTFFLILLCFQTVDYSPPSVSVSNDIESYLYKQKESIKGGECGLPLIFISDWHFVPTTWNQIITAILQTCCLHSR